MLSIFIMYSGDRSKPLEYTINCLKDMTYYEECQKTILYDDKIDSVPEGWNAILVPRFEGKFCWARMWDAGVVSANFSIVWYLDSDRLLPPNYMENVIENCKNDTFVFSSNHYMMLREMNLEWCKEFVNGDPFDYLMGNEEGEIFVKYEPKFKKMIHSPGKNAMSGNVAFTKETYYRLGGVDHWYCGHGAFADTDFHTLAHVNACEFVDTKLNELHYLHEKVEEGNPVSEECFKKMSLDNYIYYCKKWDLPISFVEEVAFNSGIDVDYIQKRWAD